MRQVEVAGSNAGQRNPSPWGSGIRTTCDPRRLGKAVRSTPPARARVISFSVKYGRRALSGSGNRQQTSHWRHVRLGTSCGSTIGGVTEAPTSSSVYMRTWKDSTRSAADTNTILQECLSGCHIFTGFPLSRRHNIPHPCRGLRREEGKEKLCAHDESCRSFLNGPLAPCTILNRRVTVAWPRMRGSH